MDRRKTVILILTLLLAVTPAALSSCESGSNEYAEAEAKVAEELDALKSGNDDVPSLSGFSEDAEISEAMMSAYIEKLRDFDYVIAGSSKSEDGESVIVTVDIKTYDFGKVYLETWNDMMKIDAGLRTDSQFYNDLFTRFTAMSVRNYSGVVSITCTRGEDGEWTTGVMTDPALINAISGGMLAEMIELAEGE